MLPRLFKLQEIQKIIYYRIANLQILEKKKVNMPVKFEFQIQIQIQMNNFFNISMSSAMFGTYLYPKLVHCLFEMQIELGILYFFLATLV